MSTATAAATATKTIFVKTFSGEILTVSIPMKADGDDVRNAVFKALPLEIRPYHSHQITLLYSHESEGEESDEDDEDDEDDEEENKMSVKRWERFRGEEGALLFMVIQPCDLEVYLDRITDAIDVKDNQVYERYRMVVTGDSILPIHTLSFYATQHPPYLFVKASDVVVETPTQFVDGERIYLSPSAHKADHTILFQGLDVRPSDLEHLYTLFLSELDYHTHSTYTGV